MSSFDGRTARPTQKTIHRRLSGYRLNRAQTSDSVCKLTRSQSLQYQLTVKNQPKRSRTPIPTEVLDRIVFFALGSTVSDSPVDCFTSISSFTLTSFDFRQIALRRFLQVLRIDSLSNWNKFQKFIYLLPKQHDANKKKSSLANASSVK